MTRQQMNERVEYIGELMNYASSHKQAIELGVEEHLYIDIANGGYQLVFRKTKSGGERSFYGNSRMTNKEFDLFTRGIINTLSILKYDYTYKENKLD